CAKRRGRFATSAGSCAGTLRGCAANCNESVRRCRPVWGAIRRRWSRPWSLSACAPRSSTRLLGTLPRSSGSSNARLVPTTLSLLGWLKLGTTSVAIFDLSADEAYRLFPDYWKAFRGETVRLAASD